MKHSSKQIKLLFEFHEYNSGIKHLYFTDPIRIINTSQISRVIPSLIEVENEVKNGLYAGGFVSYEAAPAFDPVNRTHVKSELPLVWFGLFEKPNCIDPTEFSAASFRLGEWEPDVSRSEYDQCVAKIKDEIKEGNTYQVNYTLRMKAEFHGNDFGLYKHLRHSQRGPYSAYLNIGRYRILSVSPELFFCKHDNIITTQPMKGTARRGLSAIEDTHQMQYLLYSEKNRAENVMIVDLLRNDLGRVAEFGSVRVPKLFEINKYPTVLQMTSTVQAKVRPETKLIDIFGALFPCGSVTGAPKSSTMKIIAEQETSPRGVYCGTIGYLSPQGDMTFNVPIRTVVIDKDLALAEYGVGGGITWDSTIEDEYDEILAKSAVLHAEKMEFDLLETMLLDNGTYAYLERHLQRLYSSAEFFDYPFTKSEIAKALVDHAKVHPREPRRVRLLLSGKGLVRVESVAFVPISKQTIPRVALADHAIDCRNRFHYHKTTNRGIYSKYSAHKNYVLDVILWNESEEITEFTIGNIVVELDGVKKTPPVKCGLLPGVFREELLARGDIVEQVITLQDLSRAKHIWLINSLHEWIPVQIAEKD